MGRLNKPSIDGYTYRSPGQTNAKDATPNLREDVMASQDADTDRIKRGLDTSETKPQNRSQVQSAAGRAITRSLGRAGLANLAAEAGYAAGRKLDEETGVGKKLIDRTVGPSIDRAVASQDRVTLSPEAKARIAAGELEAKETPTKPRMRMTENSSPEGKLRPGRNPEIDDETRESAGGYKKGGAVSASRRADGIAQRGKTKGRMC